MTRNYFDHNATTPLDPRVLEVMLPFMGENFANPSATYTAGRVARQAIDRAREQVAAALDADPSEVVFTASGSEASNLLIRGSIDHWMATQRQITHVACSAIEHPSVAQTIRSCDAWEWATSALAVNSDGIVSTAALSVLPADTALLSVMYANNETGAIQPIESLATLFKARCGEDAVFHTDAVQAAGKVSLRFRQLQSAGVDAMTVSAHKLGGPKGAAALIRSRHLNLLPLVNGGGQEHGLRSGTENVAAIVGMGVAFERAALSLIARQTQARQLQQQLEAWLKRRGAVIFAETAERLPNTIFAAFPGIDGETLVALLDREDVAIASGAACGSGKQGVSAVLLAMGVPPALAKGAIRVSLGMMPDAATTFEAMDHLTVQLDKVLSQLQRFAAVA